MAKRPVPKYDFKAFGAAIKAARTGRKESCKKVSDEIEKAHEIGKQLADAVTKGQQEYVLTTHIDKGHIHNHIIFCAVNFVDHHKYNSNKRSYYGIRNMGGKLCRENGLSVVVPGKGSKGKSYAEYQAEKTGTSWR